MSPIEVRLVNAGQALLYDLYDFLGNAPLSEEDIVELYPSVAEWNDLIEELTGDLGWDA